MTDLDAEAAARMARLEEARKSVRFAMEDFERSLVRASRRAGKQAAGPSFDSSLFEASAHRLRREGTDVESDGELDEPIAGLTYAVFKDEIVPLWNDMHEQIRYQNTKGTWDQDLMDQVIRLGEQAAQQGDPSFQLAPISERAQTAFPNLNGPCSFKTFRNLWAANPEALYEEVKLRFLCLEAVHDQRKTLHQTAVRLDSDLGHMYDWCHIIGKSGEDALRARASQSHAEGIDQDPQVLEDLFTQIAARDAEIADLKAAIVNMATKPAATDAHSRHSTPADSVTGAQRATKAKMKDPPRFFSDPEKDDVEFEIWYQQIEEKLECDDSLYPTDYDKFVYVKGRLSGDAAKVLLPYTRKEHPQRITTYAALMEHLWQEYYDADSKEKAHDAFDSLTMKTGDDFMAFKNKFVRLAGETQTPREQWKRALYKRLPSGLQNNLSRDYLEATCTFEQFSRRAQELQFLWRQNKDKTSTNDRNKGNNGGSKKPSGGVGNGAPKVPATKPPGPGAGKLSADEIKKLFREGRCFNCREIGHRAPDCPKGDKKQGEESRLNAIIQRIIKSNREEFEAAAAELSGDDNAKDSEN
ncbi:hypothetical protein RB600_000611 [Gaeumannomyces tritici]